LTTFKSELVAALVTFDSNSGRLTNGYRFTVATLGTAGSPGLGLFVPDDNHCEFQIALVALHQIASVQINGFTMAAPGALYSGQLEFPPFSIASSAAPTDQQQQDNDQPEDQE
jgi:hypothetical protein